MKQFNIPCFFNGVKSSVAVYIGNPLPDHNPIHFQADWLSKERGGTIPPEIMESLNKILALSIKNNVSFLELCEYALNAANEALEAEKKAVTNSAIKPDSSVAAQDTNKNTIVPELPAEAGLGTDTDKMQDILATDVKNNTNNEATENKTEVTT
jgi:Domain of unknown function (DUF2610)